MNLQHAVQHSLNVSLMRLHANKPTGTHELTPTPAYFDIVPDVGNALTIIASTQSACAQMHFRCTKNRIIICVRIN